MENNLIARKLEIELMASGRFMARVFWLTSAGWERVASASFQKVPVILCKRLNDDYGDRWILDMSKAVR